MWKRSLIYVVLVCAVAIAGEFRVYQDFSQFRISLGTPVFFFFLLWAQQLRPVTSGVLTGLTVVFFRTTITLITFSDYGFLLAMSEHLPVFFYYAVYGSMFKLLNVRGYFDRPFIIALLGIIIENLSSWAELLSRGIIFNSNLTLQMLGTIFIISFFRSFFVLGIVNFSLLKEEKIKRDSERQRNEEMLVLVADLFVEMVQLQKTMKNSERITKDCYQLYRRLIDNNDEYAQDVLKIAGEVHEIKKDNQRIHAGLQKLRSDDETTLMDINKIVDVAVRSNKSYSKHLGKTIKFSTIIKGNHSEYNHLILLSIINNLITNAVEAIEHCGEIKVKVDQIDNNLLITIADNGPGIPSHKQALIFEPGYTTKFDEFGVASTGIGLPHIKEVIQNLNGTIKLTTKTKGSEPVFQIKLPMENLKN